MAVPRVDTVLVVNCGSSSVKYRLLAAGDERTIADGEIERIGEAGGVRDHAEAIDEVVAAIRAYGAPGAIGHRVVHGGERFSAPTRVDAGVLDAIRALAELAPEHNPLNALGIERCAAVFPAAPQVAVFDTAFHATIPPHAHRYAVPDGWYRDHGVRRYGFHGTSHRWVAGRAAAALGRPLAELDLISLHLGNGASAAAIRAGRSVDTSMGLTPLEGLVMGRRSGDLDPAVALYVQRVAGLDAEAVDDALNRASGLFGLCGTSDVRELLARVARDDAAAQLALDVYVHRIRRYVGAYLAVLGRADALLFTGGVGENAAAVRAAVCRDLDGLGIELDAAPNAVASGDCTDVASTGSRVRVLVVATDEERQIARETLAVLRS